MLPFDPATLLHACAALILMWCAVMDVRHRQLANVVWIVAACLLMPLRIWVQLTGSVDLAAAVAWGVGLTAAAFIMWMLRVWGGADAKGVMLMAWMLPPFTLGPVTSHALLYAIPASLVGVLVWQRVRPGPVPFYALLAPSLFLVFLVLWFIR